ncbi:MAG: hypothetical protein AAGE86_02825 [Pseudomonadota bacterium]
MLSENALSIIVGPVGAMLIAAIISAAYAVWILRTAANPREQDGLADLFKHETFKTQIREAALLNANVRSPRRSVRAGRAEQSRSRDEMLHQIAAVMRGSERDASVAQETASYLAGEGFIIVEEVRSPFEPHDDADIIPICDFEEVKLLPPPAAMSSRVKAA